MRAAQQMSNLIWSRLIWGFASVAAVAMVFLRSGILVDTGKRQKRPRIHTDFTDQERANGEDREAGFTYDVARPIQSSSKPAIDWSSGSPVTKGQRCLSARAAANASA